MCYAVYMNVLRVTDIIVTSGGALHQFPGILSRRRRDVVVASA